MGPSLKYIKHYAVMIKVYVLSYLYILDCNFKNQSNAIVGVFGSLRLFSS